MKLIDDCDSVLGLNTNLSLITHTPSRNMDIKMPSLRPSSESPKEVEIAIIGAGLAGIALASRAWHLGYRKEDMAIYDANSVFAQNFVSRTKNINQKIMRSPYKHHLAPMEDISLSNFARLNHNDLTPDEKKQLKLDRLGERGLPPLDMFLNHTKEVIYTHNLNSLAFQMNIIELKKSDEFWKIKTDNDGTVKAKYVILALGNDINTIDLPENIEIPTVSALHSNHLSYCKDSINSVCVVGSGNTAAHVILNAIKSGKKVNWILRNEQYYRCADIPNEFWRYEGLSQFGKLPLHKRNEKLSDIYHGSAMPEHFYLFRKFCKQGFLEIHEFDEIIEQVSSRKLRLRSGTEITADMIVMANGIKPSKLPLISPSIVRYGSFPVLNDESLEVKDAENLFIASAHSALSLGPAAKNIDGMRLANERIFQSILKKENKWTSNINKIRSLAKWSTSGAITG